MDYLGEVVERVGKVAEGAAMMTETRVEVHAEEGCSPLLNNHTLSDLQYEVMELVGPISYSQAEIDFAQSINDAFDKTNSQYVDDILEFLKADSDTTALFDKYRNLPLLAENFPGIDENVIRTGSTDVGDVSWVVPTAGLRAATWVAGTAAHSWQAVAAGGTSIGTKGMLVAAKTLALTAVGIFQNPEIAANARRELEEKRGQGFSYQSLLGDRKPPLDYRNWPEAIMLLPDQSWAIFFQIKKDFFKLFL